MILLDIMFDGLQTRVGIFKISNTPHIPLSPLFIQLTYTKYYIFTLYNSAKCAWYAYVADIYLLAYDLLKSAFEYADCTGSSDCISIDIMALACDICRYWGHFYVIESHKQDKTAYYWAIWPVLRSLSLQHLHIGPTHKCLYRRVATLSIHSDLEHALETP